MPVTNVVQLRHGRMQFQALFEHVVEFEAVYDPASVNSNGNVIDTISVGHVELGDFVLCSLDIDLQQLTLHAYASAAGTVSINLVNPTAGAVNLPSCDIHVVVLRPLHLHT